MVIEIIIIIKDSEKSFRQKTLCYDTLYLDPDTPYLKGLIAQALAQFQGEPEDIVIKTTCVFK